MSEEQKQIPEGYLPDTDGNPVLASCINCKYIDDVSDGWEYGPAWYVCDKKGREHVSNLKSFPFRTSQSCCELSFLHTVDWAKEHRELDEAILRDFDK